MEAIASLTGKVAHDLNNLLTIISSNAEGLAAILPPDPDTQRDVDEIVDAATSAADLIGRLLQFSLQGMLSRSAKAPGAIVSAFAAVLRGTMPEGIDITFVDATTPDDHALVDADGLERLLLAICANARDAMRDGGTLRLNCDVRELEEDFFGMSPPVPPGRYVSVALTDSGVGMGEETLSRIFEPFFSTKEQRKTSGLGMSMAYGLMKQHDGFIQVDSQPAEGTTVTLYFPRLELRVSRDVARETGPLRGSPI